MFFQNKSNKGDAAFSFNFGGNDEPKGFSNPNTAGSFQDLSQGNRSPKRNLFNFSNSLPNLTQKPFGQTSGFNSSSAGFKTPSGESFRFKPELNPPPLPSSDQSTKPRNLGGVNSATLNGLSALFGPNNSSPLDDISSTAKGFGANLKNTDFLFDRSAKAVSPTSFNPPKSSSENVPNLLQNVGELLGLKGTPNSLGFSSALGKIDRLEQPEDDRFTSDQIDPNLNIETQNIQRTDFSNSDQSEKDGFPIKTLGFDPDGDSQNQNLDSNLSFNNDFNQKLDVLATEGDVEGLTEMKKSLNNFPEASEAFKEKFSAKIDSLVDNIKNGLDTGTGRNGLNKPNFRTVGFSEQDQSQSPIEDTLNDNSANQAKPLNENFKEGLRIHDQIIQSRSKNGPPDPVLVINDLYNNQAIDPEIRAVIIKKKLGLPLDENDHKTIRSLDPDADSGGGLNSQGDPSSGQAGSQDNRNTEGGQQLEEFLTPENSQLNSSEEELEAPDVSIQLEKTAPSSMTGDSFFDSSGITQEQKNRSIIQSNSNIQNIIGSRNSKENLDKTGHLKEENFLAYENQIKNMLANNPTTARSFANDILSNSILTKDQKRRAILAGFINGDRFDVKDNPILKEAINNMRRSEKFQAGMGQSAQNYIEGGLENYYHAMHAMGFSTDNEFKNNLRRLKEFKKISKPLLETGEGAFGSFIGEQLIGFAPTGTSRVGINLAMGVFKSVMKPVEGSNFEDFAVAKTIQAFQGLDSTAKSIVGVNKLGLDKKRTIENIPEPLKKVLDFFDKERKLFNSKRNSSSSPTAEISPINVKKNSSILEKVTPKKRKKIQKPTGLLNQKSTSRSIKNPSKNIDGGVTTSSKKQGPANKRSKSGKRNKKKESVIPQKASEQLSQDKGQTNELISQLNRAFKNGVIVV